MIVSSVNHVAINKNSSALSNQKYIPNFGMAKVVIGDDESEQRSYWKQMLSYVGIGNNDVEEASTSADAIKAIKDDTKLVITDKNYNDGKDDGGFDVLAAAKEKGVKSIMQTTDNASSTQIKAYRSGADEFVSKSEMDIESNVGLIGRLLGKKK